MDIYHQNLLLFTLKIQSWNLKTSHIQKFYIEHIESMCVDVPQLCQEPKNRRWHQQATYCVLTAPFHSLGLSTEPRYINNVHQFLFKIMLIQTPKEQVYTSAKNKKSRIQELQVDKLIQNSSP